MKSNSEYLEKFFRNLLMNEQNELKNRYLNISLEKGNVTSDVTSENIADITLRQLKIINAIAENNRISVSKLSDILNVTRMTINRDLSSLKEKEYIQRVGNTSKGYWVILKNVTS